MITPDSRSGMSTYWSRPQLAETLLDAVVAAGLDLRTATPRRWRRWTSFTAVAKRQHVLWPARRR